MASLSQWYMKIAESGDVVVYGIDSYRGSRKFVIDPSTVTICEDGFWFEAVREKREYECSIHRLYTKQYTTPIELFKSCGKVVNELKPSIMYFLYELVAGVQTQKNPALVKKPAFSLEDLKEKYSEYLGEYKNLDFTYWVDNISIYGIR